MQRGDRVSMITGGGGGFGEPWRRPPERVLQDVREGLLSVADARRDYAVALEPDADGWRLDGAETDLLRSQPPPAPAEERVRDAVPPTTPSGREADDVQRARALMDRVRARVGPDPCLNACAKRGDPVRCPFHHPMAASFWDADSLERWAMRNCQIARGDRQQRSAKDPART
jgi:hypothetical protein